MAAFLYTVYCVFQAINLVNKTQMKSEVHEDFRKLAKTK